MTVAQGVALRPLGKVLSAEEAALYRDAAEALALAKRDAARLHAEAERAVAEERQRVLATVQAEAEGAAARMLADTAAAAQQALAALPGEVAAAIADGVARVVGGLDLAEAIARAAACAMEELTERNSVVVRVSPAAAAAVRARLATEPGGVRVVADAAQPPDGCVLETRAGFVRAGLGEQLEILGAALRRASGAE